MGLLNPSLHNKEFRSWTEMHSDRRLYKASSLDFAVVGMHVRFPESSTQEPLDGLHCSTVSKGAENGYNMNRFIILSGPDCFVVKGYFVSKTILLFLSVSRKILSEVILVFIKSMHS